MCNGQWWRYFWDITKPGNDLKIPFNYEQVFSDNFQQPYTDEWMEGMGWGQPYDPNNLHQWYDPERIRQRNDGIHFSAIKKQYMTIPNAIGIIRSIQGWKYGIFIITARMPKGTYLWPAIWLTGIKNWPPEIDIVESYSGPDMKQDLQSNVHFKSNGKIDHIRAKTHPLPIDETENFVEYAVWWEADFVRFYYNGYLVREVTEKNVLDAMNEPMRLILGTGTQKAFFADNITTFVINNVTVFQQQKP